MEIHENAVYCLEQILVVTPDKTIFLRLLASHLEKLGQSHKQHSLMGMPMLANHQRLTLPLFGH